MHGHMAVCKNNQEIFEDGAPAGNGFSQNVVVHAVAIYVFVVVLLYFRTKSSNTLSQVERHPEKKSPLIKRLLGTTLSSIWTMYARTRYISAIHSWVVLRIVSVLVVDNDALLWVCLARVELLYCWSQVSWLISCPLIYILIKENCSAPFNQR